MSYEAAIRTLEHAIEETYWPKIFKEERMSCEQAIRLLEAAGKVDKKYCLLFLTRINEDEEIRNKFGCKTFPLSQIRALIESLPEPEEERK